GCEKCYCSGVSSVCVESQWEHTNITDMSGWYLTNAEGKGQVWVGPNIATPLRVTVNNNKAETLLALPSYWNAPPSYLGNKILAYGGSLMYTVSCDGDGPMEMTEGSDVIIEAVTCL
ncbi:laminin subunit alpha-2, partial [Tachysurus ichikawai]